MERHVSTHKNGFHQSAVNPIDCTFRPAVKYLQQHTKHKNVFVVPIHDPDFVRNTSLTFRCKISAAKL